MNTEIFISTESSKVAAYVISRANMHFTNIKFELIKGGTKNGSAYTGWFRKSHHCNRFLQSSSIILLFLKSTAETVINETNGSLFFMHH